MRSKTESPSAFLGADLSRADRGGQPTVTGMDKSHLRDFTRKTSRATRRISRSMRRR